MNIRFHTARPPGYVFAECCTSVYQRGLFAVARSFSEIAREGIDQARHMSAGRFRKQDVRKDLFQDTPCYLPMTYVECEAGDIRENAQATKTMLEVLQAKGFSTAKMHLRFSGNKSFWICIPAALMGHPVGSVTDQKALRQRMFLPLAESQLDENLWDARHLARLPGSTHEEGSRTQVVPFGVLDRLALLRIQWSMREPRPEKSCRALWKRAIEKTRFHVPFMDEVPRNVRSARFMKETEEGVSEGRRNEVAFKRACVEIRRHGIGVAWQELLDWSYLCDPPLGERELRSCMESARRTVANASQQTVSPTF